MDSIVLIVLVIAIAIIGIIYVLSTSGSLTNQGGTTSPVGVEGGVAICPAGSSNRIIDTKIYQSMVAIGKQDIFRPVLDHRWQCISLDNPTHVTDAVGCSVGGIIAGPNGHKMCTNCPPGMKTFNGKCQP